MGLLLDGCKSFPLLFILCVCVGGWADVFCLFSVVELQINCDISLFVGRKFKLRSHQMLKFLILLLDVLQQRHVLEMPNLINRDNYFAGILGVCQISMFLS